MTSTRRAAVAAGVHAYLSGKRDDPERWARESLEVRRNAGIAFTEPESEFIGGFTDGFIGKEFAMPDGQCLYEDMVRRQAVA